MVTSAQNLGYPQLSALQRTPPLTHGTWLREFDLSPSQVLMIYEPRTLIQVNDGVQKCYGKNTPEFRGA